MTTLNKIAAGAFGGMLMLTLIFAPVTPAHAATQSETNAQLSVTLGQIAEVLENIKVNLNTVGGGSPTVEVTSSAADLRVGMNNLFSEHVDVSADVMRDIIDDSDDLEASKEAQMTNAVEVAEVFGDLYGDDVQSQVGQAFIQHISFSNEYAAAVAKMDEDEKEAANAELDEYLHDIAGLLSSVIDPVDEETAYTVLREHEDLLNEAAEQYEDGNYSGAYETEREALKQIQVVSDVLTEGIVSTMPEDF